MAYYEDLGSCDYFGPTDGQLLAVGWLDREHVISKGQVTPQFFESLARIVANVWLECSERVLQGLARAD